MSEKTTPTKKAAAPKPEYLAAQGISFKGGRNEAGDPYTGPEESIPWLLEQGAITEA